MRLTLKTVKPEDLVLLVIRPTKHMDTDTLIVLETAVLDPKPEHTGRDVDSLCWVSIVAWWLHHISLAGAAHPPGHGVRCGSAARCYALAGRLTCLSPVLLLPLLQKALINKD